MKRTKLNLHPTSLRLAACVAFSAAIPVVANAATTAISATGWNSDIIFNGSGPYNTTVNGTLDNGPSNIDGYSYYESGTYPIQPTATATDLSSTGVNSGIYTSATGTGNTFQFQSFSANNALLLKTANSGTLTLSSSTALSTLAIYGTTGGGTSAATLVLTFSDTTTSTYFIAASSGFTRDWFKPTDGSGDNQVAVAVGGRVSNRSEGLYGDLYLQTSSRISIYESIIPIDPADQAKLIQSITFTNTGGGNMAVMALSGQAVPEPSTLGLVALCGMAGMARRRRA